MSTKDDFDLSEYGIMTKEQYCYEINRAQFDTEEFLSEDHIPVRSSMSMIQWYRRFVRHGMQYGIYIPPFESLDGCLVRESMMFIRMSQTTWRRCHSMSLRLSAIFMCFVPDLHLPLP